MDDKEREIFARTLENQAYLMYAISDMIHGMAGYSEIEPYYVKTLREEARRTRMLSSELWGPLPATKRFPDITKG